MNLINLIVWLSAGAIIGWFASRMVEAENQRIRKPVPVVDQNPKKS
jgi:hypothetical protein